MSFWRYWGLVLPAALRQTFSHALKKLVLGLVVSIIAFLLQWQVLQLRNWTDTKKIIVSLIGSAMIVMLGSFVKNLLMEPVLLHRRQQGEIDRLTPRSSSVQHKAKDIASLIEEADGLRTNVPKLGAVPGESEVWLASLQDWANRANEYLRDHCQPQASVKFRDLSNMHDGTYPGIYTDLHGYLAALNRRIQNLHQILEKPDVYLGGDG